MAYCFIACLCTARNHEMAHTWSLGNKNPLPIRSWGHIQESTYLPLLLYLFHLYNESIVPLFRWCSWPQISVAYACQQSLDQTAWGVYGRISGGGDYWTCILEHFTTMSCSIIVQCENMGMNDDEKTWCQRRHHVLPWSSTQVTMQCPRWPYRK